MAYPNGSCFGRRFGALLAIGRPGSLAVGKRPPFPTWTSPQAA